MGGALGTDLFCKPSDTHQYLHRKSCHPWHTKGAIPFSQALRIRRICSDDTSFQSWLGELSGWFQKRGYEESFVQQQIGRVRRLDREALIRDGDKQRNQERKDRVSLVTTYHPGLSSMVKVVQKLNPMLKSTEEHRKVFPESPFIAFRSKNFKDILVRSKLYNVDNLCL